MMESPQAHAKRILKKFKAQDLERVLRARKTKEYEERITKIVNTPPERKSTAVDTSNSDFEYQEMVDNALSFKEVR